MRLLLEYNQGDPKKYAPIAELLALHHESKKNWYVARDFWELQAKWYRNSGDQANETLALEKLSIAYVKEADDVIQIRSEYRVAAHHIQSAIEALWKVPNSKDRQNELHKILLEYQEKSIPELGHISGEIDLTRPVENAISTIKGKTFLDALFSLAQLASPAKKSEIEQFVDKLVGDSPLMALLPVSQVNSKGKVVAQKPSMLSDNPEIAAQAKEAEMHSWAMREQQATGMVIHAARAHFMSEHNPTLEDILTIVSHNPLVPPGREQIFSRGILFGIQGDYLAALHFLIPQLENSIRHVLNNSGVITSGLNQEGIQEEFDLKKLLTLPETTKVFGEDLVFNLQGVFVDRFGANFRNLFAHGLLETGNFQSSHGAYIWCVLLRLCCLPMIIEQQEGKAVPETPVIESGEEES